MPKQHKMFAVDLVQWMQDHKELPTFEILNGLPVTILQAKTSGDSVDLQVQSGDQEPHWITVRYTMVVSFSRCTPLPLVTVK